MADKYSHPGRAGFIRRAAADLGVEDEEDNHFAIAKASDARPIKLIENFISQACDDGTSGPDEKAKILAHCRSAVMSLRVAERAAVAMTLAAYEGLGLEIPAWLAAEVDAEHAGPNNTPVPTAPTGLTIADVSTAAVAKKRGRKPKPDPAPKTERPDEQAGQGERGGTGPEGPPDGDDARQDEGGPEGSDLGPV